MVRVPGPGRFELRLPDGAANPYLLQAVIIAAGLNGLSSRANPGKRSDNDMYAEADKVTDALKLPRNLLDAIRAFDEDKSLKSSLGDEFSNAYIKLNPWFASILPIMIRKKAAKLVENSMTAIPQVTLNVLKKVSLLINRAHKTEQIVVTWISYEIAARLSVKKLRPLPEYIYP